MSEKVVDISRAIANPTQNYKIDYINKKITKDIDTGKKTIDIDFKRNNGDFVIPSFNSYLSDDIDLTKFNLSWKYDFNNEKFIIDTQNNTNSVVTVDFNINMISFNQQ